MPDADAENRLLALAVAARPENTGRCPATAEVRGLHGASALICDLPAHPRTLHYDSADGIWWTRDGEAGDVQG